MRAARTLTIAALTVGLVATATAMADRKPGAKERMQIAAAVEVPAGCARIRVSTETEKPRWASFAFRANGASCEAFASNGVTVLRKKGHPARWRLVTAGSDFECADLYEDVPRAVVEDLGISCR